MKILSPKLTAILMVQRDCLRQEALSLKTEAEKQFLEAEEMSKSILFEAKKARHVAIIKANQKQREAELIQEAINEELELGIKEDNEAAKAYTLSQDCLLDFAKEA